MKNSNITNCSSFYSRQPRHDHFQRQNDTCYPHFNLKVFHVRKSNFNGKTFVLKPGFKRKKIEKSFMGPNSSRARRVPLPRDKNKIERRSFLTK